MPGARGPQPAAWSAVLSAAQLQVRTGARGPGRGAGLAGQLENWGVCGGTPVQCGSSLLSSCPCPPKQLPGKRAVGAADSGMTDGVTAAPRLHAGGRGVARREGCVAEGRGVARRGVAWRGARGVAQRGKASEGVLHSPGEGAGER